MSSASASPITFVSLSFAQIVRGCEKSCSKLTTLQLLHSELIQTSSYHYAAAVYCRALRLMNTAVSPPTMSSTDDDVVLAIKEILTKLLGGVPSSALSLSKEPRPVSRRIVFFLQLLPPVSSVQLFNSFTLRI